MTPFFQSAFFLFSIFEIFYQKFLQKFKRIALSKKLSCYVTVLWKKNKKKYSNIFWFMKIVPLDSVRFPKKTGNQWK